MKSRLRGILTLCAPLALGLSTACAADTTPPTLELLGQSGGGASAQLSLHGRASDAGRISRVQWRDESGGSGRASLSGDRHNPSWRIARIALQAGENRITLTARDSAGNQAQLLVRANHQRQHTLTVQRSGAGRVSSQPAGIDCGSDCSEPYPAGSSVSLLAEPAAGQRFAGWSGSNLNCPASQLSCSLTMNKARSVSASFVPVDAGVRLSVSVNGQGTVTSSPAGIACGADCEESYPSGTLVRLTATPASGQRFSGWSGEGIACPGTEPCSITLSAARHVVASFQPDSPGGSTALRLRVSGFGQVTTADHALACGSAPAGSSAPSSRCVLRQGSGTLVLSATPMNAQFRFAGWSGDCSGSSPSCTVDAARARLVQALFVPISSSTDVCAAQGLKSDLSVYPLDGSFPTLAPGQSFVDPKFGTTLRRLSDVKNDGRGSHNVLKTLYSTISAWNADESLLLLYRTDGAAATHELWDGKNYRFLRKLDDIAPVDLEQIYWDTSDPDVLYYANRSYDTLHRYRVSTKQKELVRDFSATCGAKELHGGGDPLFNSWDSQQFGFACAPDGALFSYDMGTNTLGSLLTSKPLDYGAPQAAPSGRLWFLNENDASRSDRPATVRDANMNLLRTLDLASGNEHGALSMLANGEDSWNAVAFEPGPAGSGIGSLVQHNLVTGAARVLVGPSRGYPYPPSGTHVGATAFHRTGLVAVSVKDDRRGDSLLDTELLFVDTDAQTNPAASICRVGHHRSMSDSYWAEPHPAISPSGTRILFSSSWGDTRNPGAVVNAYVLELPGYRP